MLHEDFIVIVPVPAIMTESSRAPPVAGVIGSGMRTLTDELVRMFYHKRSLVG
jgi:hypothetical protein